MTTFELVWLVCTLLGMAGLFLRNVRLRHRLNASIQLHDNTVKQLDTVREDHDACRSALRRLRDVTNGGLGIINELEARINNVPNLTMGVTNDCLVATQAGDDDFLYCTNTGQFSVAVDSLTTSLNGVPPNIVIGYSVGSNGELSNCLAFRLREDDPWEVIHEGQVVSIPVVEPVHNSESRDNEQGRPVISTSSRVGTVSRKLRMD